MPELDGLRASLEKLEGDVHICILLDYHLVLYYVSIEN
jgi:hypothetical protein